MWNSAYGPFREASIPEILSGAGELLPPETGFRIRRKANVRIDGDLTLRLHLPRATDPFSMGSYANLPPGAAKEDVTALAEPVGDRLFFAGEATHWTHQMTVHGAMLSGLREANRIVGGPILVPGLDAWSP